MGTSECRECIGEQRCGGHKRGHCWEIDWILETIYYTSVGNYMKLNI